MREVRQGKLRAGGRRRRRRRDPAGIAGTLLANPVIEDWRVTAGCAEVTQRKIGVITFPGTLDDVDAARAVRAGRRARRCRCGTRDADLHGVDAVDHPRRVLLRRLPALRARSPAFAPVMRAGGRRGPRGPAGARHLQRVPDPVRGRPAARRADPQRRPAVHLPGRWLRVEPTPRPRGPRRVSRPASAILVPLKSGEGRYVADAAHARRAGGRPGGWCSATRRPHPNGSDARHRRSCRRRRPGGRADAAPRARDRRGDRPERRRSRRCSLGTEELVRGMTSNAG